MRRITRIHDQRGFTVAEMLVASALLAPLVILLCLTMDTMLRTYSKGEQRADMQQSARIAMARLVRELRAAGIDPLRVIPQQPVPTAIQRAEVSRIAFIGDPKAEGKQSLKIEYRLDLAADPPILRRQQWDTWDGGWSGTNGAQPLANGITGAEFTYYSADGLVIPLSELPARLGEIQRVGLAVTAGSPPSQIDPETYRLIGEVQMRNVGL